MYTTKPISEILTDCKLRLVQYSKCIWKLEPLYLILSLPFVYLFYVLGVSKTGGLVPGFKKIQTSSATLSVAVK